MSVLASPVILNPPVSSARVRSPVFSRLARQLLILIAICFILRLITIAYVPLMPEEAYYWMYSQHPSLSYFDHPPMIAWIIAAGTWLFNDSEMGVRVGGNLMATAALALMYCYARIWAGRRAAICSALLLMVLPFYVWTGFIATMNSQLIFFWLIGLLGASVALKNEDSWGWYLAGIGFGGAMLSKYTGVFVGPGLMLAMLLHKPWRKNLRSPHPYIGALIGIAMFAPVIIWNARNDWASFRFQFLDRSEAHPLKSLQSFVSPLQFFARQLVVVTPLFLVAIFSLVGGGPRYRRIFRRPLSIFALSMAVPMLLALAWKSIMFDVHLDWTAPAYLSLFPLVAARSLAFLRLSARRKKVFFPRSAALTLFVCVGFNLFGPLYLLFVMPSTGHPQVFGPWHDLAMLVQRYEVQLENETHREPLVIGRGKYRLASILAFYRSRAEKPQFSSANTTSQWFLGDVEGLGFSYWLNRAAWNGRDCIYVTDLNDIDKVIASRFERVRTIDDPALRQLPGGTVYHLAICQHFKG